jgi:hypothetical protein
MVVPLSLKTGSSARAMLRSSVERVTASPQPHASQLTITTGIALRAVMGDTI